MMTISCQRPIANGMRFEVPQFIEIEDKIFGPFTWKQFIYIAGGGGFGVVLYLLNLPFIFFLLIGLPVIGLAAALAFYPINNRPFSIFLESILSYFTKNKLYLWKKQGHNTYTNVAGKDEMPTLMEVLKVSSTKENISSLSRKLELDALEDDKAKTNSNDTIVV